MFKSQKILLTIFIFVLLFSQSFSQIKDPRTFKFQPIKFEPPFPTRFTLDNGMVVYFLEDHKLPVITMNALVKTGRIYETEDKVGLAWITGEVMRTGGTSSLTAEEVNEALDYIAATVETQVGLEQGTASLHCLSKYLDEALKIYSEILKSPRFDQEKVSLEKEKVKEEIRRQNDRPDSIAFREFHKLLYPDHPYGRMPTLQTIDNITKEDLVNFHQRFFHPNNMILAVSGDITPDQLKDKLTKYFGDWEKKDFVLPTTPVVDLSFKENINYIFKDINQTNIWIGHLGYKQDNPDRFALHVMNFILGGGGFTSRLTNQVRVEQGLAYSVYSYFNKRKDLGGFFAVCQTKGETTFKALSLMREVIKKLQESGATEQELKLAKDYIINSEVFRYSTPEKIVNQQTQLEFDGFPFDQMKKDIEEIKKVSLADVNRVAKEYLHPDKMIILLVGNKDLFEKPLSELGETKEIKLEEFK